VQEKKDGEKEGIPFRKRKSARGSPAEKKNWRIKLFWLLERTRGGI
jgi:hypothetical protein